MEVSKGNIFDLLNRQIQYTVPIYQRLYSWEKEQCECLWDDIIAMNDENKEAHFLGSIVTVSQQNTTFGLSKDMVIDGQQRITTLTLLLLALRDSLKDGAEISPEDIDEAYLLNTKKNDEEKYKLILTQADKDILISLIERIPLPENTESRLLSNYKFFKDKIEKSKIELPLLHNSLSKLQIVAINLDKNHDDPQAIFESLNSTGKKLSSSDLIRNFILMRLSDVEMTEVYNKVWRPMELLFKNDNTGETMSWFFRDYLTMKNHRIPKIENVYDEFKSWRKEHNDLDAKVICDELFNYANIYTDIIYAKHNDEEINSLFKEINSMSMDVIRPFLLFVMNDYNESEKLENKYLTKEDLIEIIRLSISYVLRRSICGIPTNSLNKTYAIFSNEIKKDDYLNSVKAAYILKQDYKEFPNDEKFKTDFISKEIYKVRNRNYILDRLENYNNKTKVVIDNMTIEHVMPQTDNLPEEWRAMLGDNWQEIHEKYLHTIGNLTLTNYNSEMGCKPFIEKMEMEGGFKETNVRLNRFITKQEVWNEEKIQERALLLFEEAKEIWPYPTMTDDEFAPYKPQEIVTTESTYTLESYHLEMFTKTLFTVLDNEIMNTFEGITREYKKTYVAYKCGANIVDVIFNSNCLKIYVNMPFAEVNDSKNICRNVSEVGHNGNGEIEIIMNYTADVDDIMEIIEQAYDRINLN